ncbi:hypothetical protein [Lignipirellula cremea]|uniref:Uncharacterized protein n=1 Tax=Lignipirellula cremea TaxID=2528010 RepID=A0A518E0F7_9BACT|nr:hypothetical protein [Lignipirellula cremea]QDU97541.1 hypothetical protein Pla8534_53890 [Lignipirellula cremea]
MISSRMLFLFLFLGVTTLGCTPPPARVKCSPPADGAEDCQDACSRSRLCDAQQAAKQREQCEQRLAQLEAKVQRVDAYARQLRDYTVWRLEPDQRTKRAAASSSLKTAGAVTHSGHWETRCDGQTCRRVWVADGVPSSGRMLQPQEKE